jgi:hypothetical protein
MEKVFVWDGSGRDRRPRLFDMPECKTASIRIADTAGTNVPTTYGENVNPHSQK